MTSAVERSFGVRAVGVSVTVVYLCGTLFNVYNTSISLLGLQAFLPLA